MKLCWKISSIPELEHLTPRQRRQAIRDATRGGRRLGMAGFSLVMGLLMGGCAGQFSYDHVGLNLSIWIALVTAVLAAAVFHQYQIARIRISVRIQIKEGLAGERLPACLRCHYDLRGTTVSRCPECGAPIIVPKPDGNGK